MIELRGVSHTYVTEQPSSVTATDALVDLTVPPRQFATVIGGSGCGKTTLLRVAAGLEQPTSGEVLVDGAPVSGPGPDRAVVFQDAALYPWRTVRANVRLALELSRIATGDEAERLVTRQLALVGLSAFADQFPAQLSGGMRQRVGLARALVVSPPTLLMDEPFGLLDAIMRERMGEELLRLWEADRRTVLFVTHAIDEALQLADRVVVMREGSIVADTPVDLERPRSPDDGAYVELRAFLKVRCERRRARCAGRARSSGRSPWPGSHPHHAAHAGRAGSQGARATPPPLPTRGFRRRARALGVAGPP